MQTSAQRLSYRIASESLLLSEEKWILEALKKIKTQRNCLQIERLHLESMKAKLIANAREASEPEPESILPTLIGETVPSHHLFPQTQSEPTPSTSMVNLMQNTGNIAGSHIIEFEPNLVQVEAFCNEETLNLEVTNPVFTRMNTDFNMEENEEYDEEDVPVDMDMLMGGANMDERV